MQLGPKPTQKEFTKIKHKNYIMRMRILKQILEDLAVFNGKDPNNFGIFFQFYTVRDGEKEVRQFFTCHLDKDTVVIDDDYPKIFPIGIIWDMILAYCYEKYDNAIGLIKQGSKAKPLILVNEHPQIAEWMPKKNEDK